MSYWQQTTPIADLPDIDQISGGKLLQPNNIRSTSMTQSAYRELDDPSNGNTRSGSKFAPPVQSGMAEMNKKSIVSTTPQALSIPNGSDFDELQTTNYGEILNDIEKPLNTGKELTCVQCVNHTDNCPVCRYYYNNDNSCYIIAIIFLSITCIILLKKVLNV
jgi:hypothetical protein